MPSPDPASRRLVAQIAANDRWARTTDRTAATAKARAALQAKFEHQVDPDRKLDPTKRAQLAENARRAHYQRLALKSATARRARKAGPSTDQAAG